MRTLIAVILALLAAPLAATFVLLVSGAWAECRIINVVGSDGTWKTCQACDHTVICS